MWIAFTFDWLIDDIPSKTTTVAILWMDCQIRRGIDAVYIPSHQTMVEQLRKYPVVIFMVFTVPSIHRIAMHLGARSDALDLVRTLCIHCGGVLLFIVFISTPIVRTVNTEFVAKCFRIKESVEDTDKGTDPQNSVQSNQPTLRLDVDGNGRESDDISDTQSEKIKWSLSLKTPRRCAAASTAQSAYGEHGSVEMEAL